MAGATTAALITAGVSAATGIAGSISQMSRAKKAQREAQRELNNYERHDISPDANPYRNMRLSRLGSDLIREEAQRSSATAFDILGTAGDRAILGGLGKVLSTNNLANRQAQAELDKQFLARERAIAGGEMSLLGMREARDTQNITALNSQINAANQNYNSGVMGMASGLAYMGRASGLAYMGRAISPYLTGKGEEVGNKEEPPLVEETEEQDVIYPETVRFYNYATPEEEIPWINPQLLLRNRKNYG